MRTFSFCAKLALLGAVFALTTSEMEVPTSLHPPKYGNPLKVRQIYQLTDLGETDVDPVRLRKNPLQPSLAPAVNNLGQVIGNRAEGGFVRDPANGEHAPHVHDVIINFHGLNDRGDILVSYNRRNDPTEWMIWPTTGGSNGSRDSLRLPQTDHSSLNLIGLTNDRKVIGNVVKDNKTNPFVWSQEKGLKNLRSINGEPLYGVAAAFTNKLEIAGFFDRGSHDAPGAWSPADGIKYIRNYRSKVGQDADVVLGDIITAPDGTVYGTYRVHYQNDPTKDQDVHYAYAWSPEQGGFKLLDLSNMRINGVNTSHVLVGSLYGKAAVCWPGQSPLAISSLIKTEDAKGWDFLEASGINDSGQIVGYGKFNGKMRIFLLDQFIKGTPVAVE
jgi:hypothetical protein